MIACQRDAVKHGVSPTFPPLFPPSGYLLPSDVNAGADGGYADADGGDIMLP